jgi:hypothetical protein
MAGRWALIFTVLSLFTLANPASAADAPICAAAAPQEGLAQFFVTKSNDGYVLLLPPGLLKKLPPETDYKVSLTATNDTSAIITGHGVKKGDNYLDIVTSQTFALPSIDRNDLKSLDIAAVGSDSGARSGCRSNCPRNFPADCISEMDCSICWCFVKKKPE